MTKPWLISVTDPETGQDREVSASETFNPRTNGGRLTVTGPLDQGSPTPSDSLLWMPVNGNKVGLFDGSKWSLHTLSSTTVASATGLGLTINTNYDVFLYLNSNGLAFSLVAWASPTARAVPISLVDGVWVQTGDNTRRLLGVVRTVDAGSPTSGVTPAFINFGDAGVSAFNQRPQRFVINIDNAIPLISNTNDSSGWTFTASSLSQIVGNDVENWTHELLFPFIHSSLQFRASVLVSPAGTNVSNLFHFIPLYDGVQIPQSVAGHNGIGGVTTGAQSLHAFMNVAAAPSGAGLHVVTMGGFTNAPASPILWSDVGGAGFGGMSSIIMG